MTTTTWYELEAHDGGCWSVSNTSPDPYATRFETLAEARAEIDYWEGEGRDITTLRIVRVTPTHREVVY